MDARERVMSGQKSEWKKRAENHYRNDVLLLWRMGAD